MKGGWDADGRGPQSGPAPFALAHGLDMIGLSACLRVHPRPKRRGTMSRIRSQIDLHPFGVKPLLESSFAAETS